jgi:hypothetical protein
MKGNTYLNSRVIFSKNGINQNYSDQQKSAQNFIPNPYFALKTAPTLHLHQNKKTCAQLG